MIHSHYESILQGNKKPKFKYVDLDKKISEVKEIMKDCKICPRKCSVNRIKGEKGFCKVLTEPKIFGIHAHYGEEQELVPSGTIFFSGCTMKCVYCQNAPASINPELGEYYDEKTVAEKIDRFYSGNVENVNFVNPECFLLNILKILKNLNSDIPVIWNSSSYYSKTTAELIKDIVDLYLLDFRYFDDECAIRLSSSPHYLKNAKQNNLIAKRNADLLVRVLVMPGHFECCTKPIMKWIKENLGENTRVNIMDQYRPCFKAQKFPEISRSLTVKEFNDVLNFAKKLGLKNLV